MSKIKKIVIFLLITIIIVSSSALGVSALNAGGTTLNAANSKFEFLSIPGGVSFNVHLPFTSNNGDGTATFGASPEQFYTFLAGTKVQQTCYFTFDSEEVEGKFRLGVSTPDNTKIIIDNATGLWDNNTGKKIKDYEVVDFTSSKKDNYVEINYSGDIPSSLYVRVRYEILEDKKSTNVVFRNYSFKKITDADREKEEAEGSSNEALDDATEAMPNESAGFVNGIANFVKSMSYDGTEAKWTFPALKLPKISGVMEELPLSEEKEIDFGFWVQSIPPNVLSIIQIVCTIALIVYCFKEMYSQISYLLTLKGGGAGE